MFRCSGGSDVPPPPALYGGGAPPSLFSAMLRMSLVGVSVDGGGLVGGGVRVDIVAEKREGIGRMDSTEVRKMVEELENVESRGGRVMSLVKTKVKA
jgi:hypothetical protein